ncbi:MULTISPECIES: class I SAM-dependent methyltransferase [Dyella]|uniref:Class I SAM-dependent methyltransferase n=2 Tax=Dyella TaxID=231454 RepID=A0A4R0YU42_9GAMM|nr:MULTISPECIES: class I SAM-dependent methyltransferase [Dyella]TBR35815.1 hypothetical protein EYV96_17635 [Dyella terrae]TCI08637.1 hypothetical protein EZM97_28920 [Dyella soli]
MRPTPDLLRAHFETIESLETLLEEDPSQREQVTEHLDRLDQVTRSFIEPYRRAIAEGNGRRALLPLLTEGSDSPPSAHSYDHLDSFLAELLPFDDPGDPVALSPDMVFYQPTPARHAFAFLHAAQLTANDTLIDIGSGLGHVPLLAAITSDASCMGIEQDMGLVRSATSCAEALHLSRIAFHTEDARDADFSRGTVFYLYSPFTGAMLDQVIERLRLEAAQRPFRIGTLGPCTNVFARQPWLHAASVDEHRPTLFYT